MEAAGLTLSTLDWSKTVVLEERTRLRQGTASGGVLEGRES